MDDATSTKPAWSRRAILIGAGAGILTPHEVARSRTTQLRSDLAAVFTEHGTTGTFAALDVGTSKLTLVNEARARQRIVPASTFKIANTLIALETGAVRDENEVLPFDGTPQPFKSWERDMGLREAIAVSNVPVYQAVARRVGMPAYREWLTRLGYGNQDPGTAVDRFWLDGPLQISAAEQVELLARLAKGELPMTARSQSITRDIVRIESRSDGALFAKTGWLTAARPQIGWWVGWVERKGRIAAFALNMDMQTAEDAPRRLAAGRALLGRLGLY